ncbi:MAG: hypothetical protein FWC96_04265 [Oscillospiraceae bacterium]|nr:hypothetical protein [Oscillospiraceae bacterium]
MKIKTNYKWVIKIVLISVIASILFTLLSTEVLGRAGYIIAFAVLAVFIAIGIFVDIIAIAVTVAHEASLHSMAAHKVRGAAESLRLKKNADRVTSFCNDVIGDVTGIISGATAALIAARLMTSLNTESLLLSLLLTGIVTGLSVGGKAVAKAFAFNHSISIVLWVGRLINLFKKTKG